MNIYFKLPKNSETGIKLAKLLKRDKMCQELALNLARKYGFDGYQQGFTAEAGGITGFHKPIHPDTLDKSIWKSTGNNLYMPKVRNKTGKEIMAEVQSLPEVSHTNYLNIFGIETSWNETRMVGLRIVNDSDYFGVASETSWKANYPNDLIEITATEYSNL